MEQLLKEENAIKTAEAKLKPEHRTSPNRRIKKHFASKRWIAKMSWLERIHQEIWDKKPQWEKDMIETERRGPESEDLPVEKPELTGEYMKKLGYE